MVPNLGKINLLSIHHKDNLVKTLPVMRAFLPVMRVMNARNLPEKGGHYGP